MPAVSFTSTELEQVTECVRSRREQVDRMYALLHKANPARVKLQTELTILEHVAAKFRTSAAKAKR